MNETVSHDRVSWHQVGSFSKRFQGSCSDPMGVSEFTRECCQTFGRPSHTMGSGMMSVGKLSGSHASKQPWRYNGFIASGNTWQEGKLKGIARQFSGSIILITFSGSLLKSFGSKHASVSVESRPKMSKKPTWHVAIWNQIWNISFDEDLLVDINDLMYHDRQNSFNLFHYGSGL